MHEQSRVNSAVGEQQSQSYKTGKEDTLIDVSQAKGTFSLIAKVRS